MQNGPVRPTLSREDTPSSLLHFSSGLFDITFQSIRYDDDGDNVCKYLCLSLTLTLDLYIKHRDSRHWSYPNLRELYLHTPVPSI